MIDPKNIDKLANEIDNNSQSDLQKLYGENNTTEKDLLKEFVKEVDSPFLKDNRRKPKDLKTPKIDRPQAQPTDSQNETVEDDEEYGFDDLEETDSSDSQEDMEDGKEFSKDIVSFLMEGVDYGVNKGAELGGYKKKSGSSDLTRQKEAVIKYGTKVLEKYDFKMKAEHMLLIALVFYVKAVAGQFEKDKEDDSSSHLKLVKPLDKGAKPKQEREKVVKMETAKKPTVKQSLL